MTRILKHIISLLALFSILVSALPHPQEQDKAIQNDVKDHIDANDNLTTEENEEAIKVNSNADAEDSETISDLPDLPELPDIEKLPSIEQLQSGVYRTAKDMWQSLDRPLSDREKKGD